MTPLHSKKLLALPVAAALMGCSANVASSAEAADAEASPVTAVVVVERTTRVDERAESTRGEAVARFVRMRSGVVDEDALRMIGATVDIPAAGTCVRVSGAGGTTGTTGSTATVARAVELVDVGSVSLEAEGKQTTFNARRLPDVVDLVAGVVYTGRGEEPFPAHGRFLFRAGGPTSGAADFDIGPFTVESIVSGEPADIRVNQELVAQAPITLAAGTAIELSWGSGAAGGSGDASDLVYVDVAGNPGGAGSGAAWLRPSPNVTRCAFADMGHGVVPAVVLAGLGAVPPAGAGPTAPGGPAGPGLPSVPAEDGTLSLHRVHRETFRARGIDSGEIRFDFGRVVSFHRR